MKFLLQPILIIGIVLYLNIGIMISSPIRSDESFGGMSSPRTGVSCKFKPDPTYPIIDIQDINPEQTISPLKYRTNWLSHKNNEDSW